MKEDDAREYTLLKGIKEMLEGKKNNEEKSQKYLPRIGLLIERARPSVN